MENLVLTRHNCALLLSHGPRIPWAHSLTSFRHRLAPRQCHTIPRLRIRPAQMATFGQSPEYLSVCQAHRACTRLRTTPWSRYSSLLVSRPGLSPDVVSLGERRLRLPAEVCNRSHMSYDK